MAEIKEATFTISRQDLAYGHVRSFDNLVAFRMTDEGEFKRKTGIVGTEQIGYDFKGGSRPSLKFSQFDLGGRTLSIDGVDDFKVVITVTDVALRIRELVMCFPLDELSQGEKTVSIDLTKYEKLGLYGGYEVGVFIKPGVTDYDKTSDPFWSESQVVHSSVFSYRAAADSSLFEINYAPFGEGSRDVLYTVDWLDNDVTRIPASSSFEVTINVDHKNEFLLLQSNSRFGALGARFIFSSIMREVIEGTLMRAEIDDQIPIDSDSAHFHLKNLFENYELDFGEYAALSQSDSSIERAEASEAALRVAQRVSLLGSHLSKQNFSG